MPTTKSAAKVPAPKKIKAFVPPKRLEKVRRTQTLRPGTLAQVVEQAVDFAQKHKRPQNEVRLVQGRYGASPYLLLVTPETDAERITRGKRLARDRKIRAENARKIRAHAARRFAEQEEAATNNRFRTDPVGAIINSPAFAKAIEAGVAAGIKAAGVKT